MLERLSGERARRAIAVGLVGAIALFGVGCSTTSKAEKSKYSSCSADYSKAYDRAGKPVTPSVITETEVPLINEDLKLLRRRAKLIDGRINISDTEGGLTLEGYGDKAEVQVEGGKNIRLRFNTEDPFKFGTTDVLFSSSSPTGDFKVSPGSIACTQGQEVYRNQVNQSIKDYTEVTKNLH